MQHYLFRIGKTHLGDREKADPSHDEQGHGVEPTADVGENPEGKTELDGVEHVLHHEEAPQLFQGAVQLLRSPGGVIVHLLRGNSHLTT